MRRIADVGLEIALEADEALDELKTGLKQYIRSNVLSGDGRLIPASPILTHRDPDPIGCVTHVGHFSEWQSGLCKAQRSHPKCHKVLFCVNKNVVSI